MASLNTKLEKGWGWVGVGAGDLTLSNHMKAELDNLPSELEAEPS